MPVYTPTALKKLQHKSPSCHQDDPHTWNKHVYGKHIKLPTQKIPAPKLKSVDTNNLQSINGTLLYYANVVELTMLPDLNKISICQC